MPGVPFVPNPKKQPAPDGKQPVNVRPGSALAVLGVFVEVIRKRFPKEAQLPYVWYEDIKEGQNDAIAIESAFNEDKDSKNFRTAIYVDRDEQVIGRTVLGDRAGVHLPTSREGFWALETVPMLVECVAAKKAESAIIADLVGIYLHASSDLIQAAFGFHEMTPVTRGRTQPFPRDKTQWITPISFSVQFSLRWTSAPTAPLLKQIEASVSGSGFPDATAYFETIALYGSNK